MSGKVKYGKLMPNSWLNLTMADGIIKESDASNQGPLNLVRIVFQLGKSLVGLGYFPSVCLWS